MIHPFIHSSIISPLSHPSIASLSISHPLTHSPFIHSSIRSAIQKLRVCVESLGWQWSDSIDLDTLGTSDYVIDKGDQRATIVVTVTRLNNMQKKVGGEIHVFNLVPCLINLF